MVIPSIIQPSSLTKDHNTSEPTPTESNGNVHPIRPVRQSMGRFVSSSRVRLAQKKHDERAFDPNDPANTAALDEAAARGGDDHALRQILSAMAKLDKDGRPVGGESGSDTEGGRNSSDEEMTRVNSLTEEEKLEIRKAARETEGADKVEADRWIRNIARSRANTSADIHEAIRKEKEERDPRPIAVRATTEDAPRKLSGEWIEPVHAAPATSSGDAMKEGVQEKEGRVVIPAFYRTNTVDQAPLVHRLAVLSVNNFSGDPGLGEEDVGEEAVGRDRELAKEALHPQASKQEIDEMAAEIKRERIHKKSQEIEYSLKHDDAEDLKEKLAPAAFLNGDAGIEGQPHPSGHSAATREPLVSTAGQQNDQLKDEIHGERVKKPTQDEGEEAEEDAAIEADRKRRATVTGQQKIEAIQEEFGELAALMEGDEPESYVGECKGALFRGIMIIGNIHMTSHRIAFHAILPPPKMAPSGDDQAEILHSGAITIHRSNVLVPKPSRVWMELGPEMITTYPSADEEGRVKPLRSILLSSVDQLFPLNTQNPFQLKLKYNSPKGEKLLDFSVDTEESALQWHRDLESALFQYGRAKRYKQRMAEREKRRAARPDAPTIDGEFIAEEDDGGWEVMRISLPLDRIHEVGTDDYMDFATIVSVDVDIMEDDPNANICVDSMRRISNQTPDNPNPREYDQPREPAPSGFKKLGNLFKRNHGNTAPQHPENDASPHPSEEGNGGIHTGNLGSPAFHHKKLGGKGAFQGPPQDPADLTSNASIVPAAPDTGTDARGKVKATVNVKFGILNERADFVDVIHNTIVRAEQAQRRYKAGVIRPHPIVQVGTTNLLELREVEGGAGLNAEGTAFKHGHHHGKPHRYGDEDSGISDDSSSDEEQTTSFGDPGGVRASKKRKNVEIAKATFGIPAHDTVWMKRCYLNSSVPFRGHIILSDKFLCFWRKQAGPIPDIKYRFPIHDIKGAEYNEAFRLRVKSMSVKISGRHDLHFEFFSPASRSKTTKRINELVEKHAQFHRDHPELDDQEQEEEENREREAAIGNTVGINGDTTIHAQNAQRRNRQRNIDLLGVTPEATMSLAVPDRALAHLPAIANDFGGRRKISPRRFALLTIGSRGDVQPYIAIGLGLMKDGHQVVIVTHDEFKEWVEGYGIEHRQAGGDPAALMKLSVEHTMFSPGFFKESLGGFRTWLDDLLEDSWQACQDADVLIESPSAMAGIHIAEALGIPYFRAFTMPWTRTSKYPQAFMVPPLEMGPGYNYSSYVLFDNIMWTATAPQINKWRKKSLAMQATDMSKLSQTKVPFMYNFSPFLVPKPLDWHDDIAITGYWTLQNSDTDWSPPKELDEFMAAAEREEKPLVYIGFGSITVPDPDGMTKNIVKAVDKANVRAIIAKGWSSKGNDHKDDPNYEPPKYSSNCFPVDKVPHGWLFPKIKAALHHGGAGTVGASLTHGLPTLIKPWFGVGMKLSSLDVDDLAEALDIATRDTVMIERAAMIGEKIRSEDGVKSAVNYVYANLPRAGKDRTQLKWQGS